jgi:uncharacterized integral membrane protein (TIGR00698 family)
MLIALGLYLAWSAKKEGAAARDEKMKLVIPWFAVYFIMVAGFNSLHLLPLELVDIINEVDTFLLTMAMTALGMGTIFSKFKGLGLAPIYTATTMFVWLVMGGFVVTKLDGTAKGGIVFAVSEELKKPIKFIGVGEGIEDLREFKSKEYIEAIFE